MTRRVLLLPALCVLLASAACTDSPAESSEQGTVKAAYLAYWEAALEAHEEPDADNRLPAVATGEQLRADQMLVEQRQQAGEHVRGSYEHVASVTTISATEAVVEDCMTGNLTLAGPKGERQLPSGPYAVSATLVQVDGTWLVEQLRTLSEPCPATSAPTLESARADR